VARARADTVVSTTIVADRNGAGARNVVETPSGVLYWVFEDANSDICFKKSTDGGISWSGPTLIFAGTATGVAIWYDRWSGINAGLIHVAYQDSGVDDTFYRTINTESSDALSTQTTIQLGASTASGGTLAITRAVGGNVYCATMIDAGAEGGFFRLPNANVPNGAWDAARTTVFEAVTDDQILLAPDFDSADNQDILAIFWDASANEISRKNYDDSANTWTETSIATSMVDAPATSTYPHFSIATDPTNTRLVLLAWNGVDTLNADLRAWHIDASTITALTDVVTNSTDDQGLCAITIDANGWYWAFYFGATAGGETWSTAINLYCKVSKDSGTTWEAETKLTEAAVYAVSLYSQMRCYLLAPAAVYFRVVVSTPLEYVANVLATKPRAAHQLFGG
jgi:hypothetical protein